MSSKENKSITLSFQVTEHQNKDFQEVIDFYGTTGQALLEHALNKVILLTKVEIDVHDMCRCCPVDGLACSVDWKKCNHEDCKCWGCKKEKPKCKSSKNMGKI